MTNAILRGKSDAGNPHVRFDEGDVASAKPRRGSLLYKSFGRMVTVVGVALSVCCLAMPCEARDKVPGDGMIPFLAITGRPTATAVRAKVSAIAAQGIESFVIYARSGLELEYLGDEWLRLCEWFCDEAEKHGLKVWLYDEYNWPSGTCKGRVPQERDEWRYREWGVFADGKGGYRWDSGYGPVGWVNVYEQGATDRFIELTHELYAKRLKRWFDNKTILGIFTDEPGHYVDVTFEAGKPEISMRAYTGLEDEYRARTGRDFRRDVERWLTERSPSSAEVWEHYAALLGKRFRLMYFDKLRDWCDAHGILLTGHMISENYLSSSCRANGDPMLCLRGESLPGMDEIRTAYDPLTLERRTTVEWLTFNVARQAILHRGNGGLAELFACGPADLTPSVLRELFWISAFHGVDHYVTCMDVMDERGLLEKHIYLSPAGPVHPWYAKHAHVLAEEARLAATFARKRVVEREVAVRYPNRAAARACFAKEACPNVNDLLRVLEINQMTCRLVGEDEATDLGLVFVCNPDGTYDEERSGSKRITAKEAVALCRSRLPKPSFEVLEPDGAPAEELLVRTYDDGTSALVNMRKFTARRLVAVRGGQRSVFTVPAHGVRIFAVGELPADEAPADEVRPLADVKWKVSRDRENVHRVNFKTGRVGTVGFAENVMARPILRDCAQSYAIDADGVRIVRGALGDRALPEVYSPLYRTAEARLWKSGEHVFDIVSGEADTNYFLPAMFLAGDFRVFDGKLFAEKKDAPAAFGSFAALGYPTYAGALTWRAEVLAPVGMSLRVETGKSVVSVRFCGVELGVRAWAPFEWNIPRSLQGRKGELEITVYSSAQPLFGEFDIPGAAWDMKPWLDLFAPDSACGLFSAEWIRRAPPLRHGATCP